MIEQRKTARYLVSGAIWSVGGQVFSVLGVLLQMSMLSRLLSTSDMGSYMLIYSVIMFFSIFGMFGIPETMMREVARLLKGETRSNSDTRVVINQTYLLVIFFTLLLSLLTVGFGGHFVFYQVFNIAETPNTLLYIGTWLFLHCLHYTTVYLYRGLHDVFRATIYGVSIRSLFVVLVLSVFYLFDRELSLEQTLLINVLVMLATLFVSILPIRYVWLDRISSNTTTFPVKELMHQATPLCMNAAFQEVFLRSGMWMLGYFVVKEEVALYGAALQLVVLLVIPVRIFNGVLPPVISNYYFNKDDTKTLEKIVRSTSTISTIMALGGLCVMLLFGKQILSIVYGEYYSNAYGILMLLLVGHSTTVFFGPTRQILKMTKHQSELFRVSFLFGVLTVIVTSVCAWSLNALWVAAGTSFVLVCANFRLLKLTKSYTGIWPITFLNIRDLFSLKDSLRAIRGARK